MNNKTKAYLRDILQCIERIQRYTVEGYETFNTDEKTQDAVARNFEIIGEAVKRIPSEILALQSNIPWRAIAGFRDVLIHDYAKIDLDEVWLSIERDLPSLKIAIQFLLDTLDEDTEID